MSKTRSKPAPPRYAAKAQIEPTALRQAMARAQVDEAVLAKYIGTSHNVINSWLEGTKKPSFRQARKAADRTRIPFGFLFLENLPADALPIPDFRVVSGSDDEGISLDLREVIQSTLRKQSWLSGYLESEEAGESDFIGKGRISDSVDDLAEGISSALNISAVARTNKPADYLRSLVHQVEQMEVYVLRSGIVGNNTSRALDVKEFRGFALSDKYAPFVFINSKDSPRAQIFTLIHELCHLWCDQTGISSSSSSIVDTLRLDSDEAKCNQVAAEILVPRVDLMHQWNKNADTNLDASLENVSKYFQVSKLVILIRLKENSLISQQEFEMTYSDISLSQDRNPVRTKGGDYHTNIAIRNGRKFTETVLNATLNQHLLLRDAADLLSISPAQVVKLSERLL